MMADASSSQPGLLRPLDVRRDLPAVADLIEICFSNHMDAEGRDYIGYVRRVAYNPSLVRWVPGAAERVSLPLHGFVYEEAGRVIGNLSLIPFVSNNRWLYLIANVAVHPDFRRQGIGRRLTLRAIEHLRRRDVHDAWLQVRDDNPAACQLYQSLGFVERARRTTWQGNSTPLAELPGQRWLEIHPREKNEWPQQARWLQEIYPSDVSWNLSFDWRRLRPGLLRAFTAWLNGETLVHWSARSLEGLAGMATWELGRSLTDLVWLGVDPAREDETIASLLAYLRGLRLSHHYLTVNYPAGRGVQGFQHAGFAPLNTLIWMRLDPFETPAT